MERDNRGCTRYTSPGLVPGLVVAALGVLFLLNNLKIVRIYEWWLLWPVILIVIGLQKLIDSPHSNERGSGGVMIAVGTAFLATNLGWVSASIWEWWPLLLIAAGLAMLFNRTGHGLPGAFRMRWGQRNSGDGIAIFGGFKRQISADDFRGASYIAFCGGGEIDLRRAQIIGDGAVIQIQAMFGGFEIKVPTNWAVTTEMLGIFGGTSDETLQPAPDTPGVKRLVIRGIALFGGVGIKN